MRESLTSYAMWKKDALDGLNRPELSNWARFLPYATYLTFPVIFLLFLSNALGVAFALLRTRAHRRRLAKI